MDLFSFYPLPRRADLSTFVFFSDTHDSTSLYVPSIGLIVAGDVAYNGVHLYTAETTPDTRKEWRNSLDMLAGPVPRPRQSGLAMGRVAGGKKVIGSTLSTPGRVKNLDPYKN